MRNGSPDVGQALSQLENTLRDLAQRLLSRDDADDAWLAACGVTANQLREWRRRRDSERIRRPGGQMEPCLLYYADLRPLFDLMLNNWDAGFNECFPDQAAFRVYADRLCAFRNPDAHSRSLMPFERHLAIGMAGQIRQEVTLFLSRGGRLERERWPRIEEVVDNYGLRATGMSGGGRRAESVVVLRPGATVTFSCRAWDPDGLEPDGILEVIGVGELATKRGLSVEIEWAVDATHVGERVNVVFWLRSPRAHHRHLPRLDDQAELAYSVVPND